mgnify:FL=1|jgi:hypothetical protein
MTDTDTDTYTKKPTRDFGACLICSFITTMVSVMFFLIFVLFPVINYQLLQETTCNVTRVDYPTTLPSINYGIDSVPQNDQDWVECDCGRRCISWTPCIRIFQGDTMIRETVSVVSISHQSCSFNNYSCPNGEDIRLINQTLNDAMELAESYIGYNGTCFETEDMDFIALTNNLDITNIVLFSVFLFIMIICCGFVCLTCSRNQNDY